MDIAIAGVSALEVVRGVRRNANLTLEQVDSVDTSRFACERGAMAEVNFLAIGLAATPTKARPVTIRVPDARHRKQAKDVHSLTFPSGLSSPCLLRLRHDASGDERVGEQRPEGDVFDGRYVFVDSVPLACLTVAASYQRLIRAGRLGEADAVVRLVELIMEFAGRYARDPADPLGGGIVEDVPPMTTVGQIEAFVGTARGVQGVRLLGRALRFARDGSRSAMETCLWIVLTMPASYGLFEFTGAKLNVPVVATEAQRALMKHRTLTPDIQWDDRGVAVEYQGLEPHSGRAAHTEDNRRMNDYQVCGIRAFFVVFDDVRSVAKFDSLALDVAKAMRDHGHPGELRRIQRLLEDGVARRMRARLLAHLLPPVHREE